VKVAGVFLPVVAFSVSHVTLLDADQLTDAGVEAKLTV